MEENPTRICERSGRWASIRPCSDATDGGAPGAGAPRLWKCTAASCSTLSLVATPRAPSRGFSRNPRRGAGASTGGCWTSPAPTGAPCRQPPAPRTPRPAPRSPAPQPHPRPRQRHVSDMTPQFRTTTPPSPPDNRQQPHKTSQTRRLRNPPLRALPHPRAPLRRQTQLDPPQRPHSPLKSEAPDYRMSPGADGAGSVWHWTGPQMPQRLRLQVCLRRQSQRSTLVS